MNATPIANDAAADLRGGDRRSIGSAQRWAQQARENPNVFDALVELIRSREALVSMRAADAVEKASRAHPEYLQPHRRTIVSLLRSAPNQEVRWHAAMMASRLQLAQHEARSVARLLRDLLDDRSVIVRVSAIQALVELADREPKLRVGVQALVGQQAEAGAPAVKARCRKLLNKPMGKWPATSDKRSARIPPAERDRARLHRSG